jgi:hypothetical protein
MPRAVFRTIALLIFFQSISTTPPQQNLPTWHEQQKTDPFRGTSYVQFTLEGKFLAAPQTTALQNPLLVVRCAPGEDRKGHTKGKFVSGYIATGAVLDSEVDQQNNSTIIVQFRLNGGKIQTVSWRHSANFSAILMSDPGLRLLEGSGYEEFANLLYGHAMYHKEGTSPQVKSVLIDVPEWLGGEIVMQFDFPDSTTVADKCGIIWHK